MHDIHNYIVKGMLWQAFSMDTPVLLIDEVDKADIEFPTTCWGTGPHGVLYETRELVKARQRPIVFITSNNEKELPAFLRRCFFYVHFDKETVKIVRCIAAPEVAAQGSDGGVLRCAGAGPEEEAFDLRAVDWLKLLLAEDIPPEALRSKDRKTIVPPLHGALLKTSRTCTSSSGSCS